MKKNYEVAYCKPPLHSRFKKGVCPNPHGRPKSESQQITEIIRRVLDHRINYKTGGAIKSSTRLELIVKRLIAKAIQGDTESASTLLKMRAKSLQHGSGGPLVVTVVNAIPDDF